MPDFDPPPFPRGRIKIRRINPSADGTIERSPAATSEDWWQSVLSDPRGRGNPLDYDTLWFNRDDTVDLSCDGCKMSAAVKVADLLARSDNLPGTKVGEAIGVYVNCPRRAKRCGLGYRLRNRRR